MKSKKESMLEVLQDIRDALKSGITVPKVVVSKVINARFTDNGDGTITDKQLNVMWIKNPQEISGFNKSLTFDEAKSACAKLSFAGKSDWRMPTVEELRSIVDYTRHDPVWDTDVFDGKHDNWYWTSTVCSWKKDAAWCVGSNHGGVSNLGKLSRTYVRPVRSCQ